MTLKSFVDLGVVSSIITLLIIAWIFNYFAPNAFAEHMKRQQFKYTPAGAWAIISFSAFLNFIINKSVFSGYLLLVMIGLSYIFSDSLFNI